MKDKWSNVTYEVVCQCSGDNPMYVVKDEQGHEKKYNQNHLLFIASSGSDSDVKPLGEPLTAGSSNGSTDTIPMDVTSNGNEED